MKTAAEVERLFAAMHTRRHGVGDDKSVALATLMGLALEAESPRVRERAEAFLLDAEDIALERALSAEATKVGQ